MNLFSFTKQIIIPKIIKVIIIGIFKVFLGATHLPFSHLQLACKQLSWEVFLEQVLSEGVGGLVFLTPLPPGKHEPNFPGSPITLVAPEIVQQSETLQMGGSNQKLLCTYPFAYPEVSAP